MKAGDMVTVIISIGDVRHELTVEQARLLYERLRIMFASQPVHVTSSWTPGPFPSGELTVGSTQNE